LHPHQAINQEHWLLQSFASLDDDTLWLQFLNLNTLSDDISQVLNGLAVLLRTQVFFVGRLQTVEHPNEDREVKQFTSYLFERSLRPFTSGLNLKHVHKVLLPLVFQHLLVAGWL
jgi:hypothetical protein